MQNARMKRIIATVLTCLFLAIPACTGLEEAGVAAYKRGDYIAAVREIRPLAKQGFAHAQSKLGYMYANGLGVRKDYARALIWFRRAAEQGDAEAQNNLGLTYYWGKGVPKNYVKAHMWYNLADIHGFARAAKDRDIVATKMTTADVSQARKLMREWLNRH